MPMEFFNCAAPAMSVFIDSLTDAPIKGITLAVANFIPLKAALSLLAARLPLKVTNAKRKENEKMRVEVRFFFKALVVPKEENGG